MKLRKRILSVLIAILMLVAVGAVTEVNAGTKETKKLGIERFRRQGYAYAIYDDAHYVHEIAEYPASATEYANQNLKREAADFSGNFYCIKAGPGFANTDMSGELSSLVISTYEKQGDLRNVESIEHPYKDVLPTGSTYNSLVWILEHCYIAGNTSSKTALANAVKTYAETNTAINDVISFHNITFANGDTFLTDDDIEVVQQLAIWYYTNASDPMYHTSGSVYDHFISLALQGYSSSYESSAGTTALSEAGVFEHGESRQENAQLLFWYLVDKAKDASAPSTSASTSDLITITPAYTGRGIVEEGNNYIIGPFQLNAASVNVTYNLTSELKNGNSNITHTILDASKNTSNLNSVIGRNFYISVNKNLYADGMQFTVNATATSSEKVLTYWSEVGTTAEQLRYNKQPVIEIGEKTPTFNPVTVSMPSRERAFDFGLRKFITSINGVSLSDSNVRVPQVDVSPLRTSTTAIYRHQKAPVSVAIGDEVIYTIRIYNEGELDGYVTSVTDYLPAQLEYVSDSTLSAKYNYETKSDGSVVITYKSGRSKKIAAFNGTGLDYDEVQIKCRVKSANAGYVITNIAEISGFTDENGNTVTDRDSTINNVTKPSDWPGYVGKEGNNNTNLANKQGYWAGQEDDDDFDKLQVKTFDMALRKYVTALLDKNGNPKTVTSRIPQIGTWKYDSNQTLQKSHTKEPLEVSTGDIVRYTITVYNEGETAGKVTKVTDYLPEGLMLKSDSAINTIWSNPSGDGRTIETTALQDTIIEAYDESSMTEPDHRNLQVECVVVAQPGATSKSMQNIAEITACTDRNGNAITDRDSTPGNVNRNSYNPTNPADGRGQEDDDDADEIVLSPKEFDLALTKFITSVKDANGNTKTIASREPQIGNWKFDNNRTLQKTHSKEAIKVETGDTIVYTIRVYNEGGIDGKATKVTDYLQDGLKLKENSTINTNNGWTNPSNDGKTIESTKLANTVITAYDGTTLDYEDLQIECVVIAEAGSTSKQIKNIAEITEIKDAEGNSITDRDSQPGNVNKNSYNPTNPGEGRGEQDDDDGEDIIIPARVFDLALRKFVTQINDTELKENGRFIKEPVVDTSKLDTIGENGEITTAEYKHQKAPVGVKAGDEVIYTIRVYNEGGLDGYVTEITDHLPAGLEFVNDEFNAQYGWSANGSTITTTITSPNTSNSANRDLIYADRTTDNDKVLLKAFNGSTLDYIDVKIKCKVASLNSLENIVTNIAEITGFTDKNGEAVTDRDTSIGNISIPTTDKEWADYKGNSSNKSVLTDSSYHYKGQQDGDDFEKIILQEFDLALRKFVTGVNDTRITNRYPRFTTNKDENGNFVYEQAKGSLTVETTDLVEYTIRVFNEGDIDGYAKLVKDNIPSGLEFVADNSINTEYRWKMLDENGEETSDNTKAKYIVTDYLSKEQELATGRNNLIEAFDSISMTEPNYKDVKVVFKVVASSSHSGIITNIAEIADDSDENGNPITDRDSTPDNNDPKEDDTNSEYIQLKFFDLALTKFITAVNDTEVTNRIPQFKVTEDGKYAYEYAKDPVSVENGNIITYTIRVYNEGTMAGFAKQIKDNLPDSLIYLPENDTNKEYRWVMLDENGEETEDISKAVSIATDYLSKEQQDATGRDNLLKAFDVKEMEQPDYRDVKIAFKVTEPSASDRIIINKAQIADDSDENGNEVVDKDSTPDKWIDGEDDQNTEKVKVKYFDLRLTKWTTQTIVIENGKQKVTNTGHKPEDNPEKVVKVEIVKSKINSVVVKFRYSIRVTNEGEIAGYATEITDYIPSNFKFIASENPDWKESNGKITTTKLADKLLQPGESAEVEVLLTWVNGANNMGQKVNIAEISQDKNDSNTPDIDSTPGNKKDGEDDMNDATVLIATKTGELINTEYVFITAMTFAILASGVVLIKKYIL